MELEKISQLLEKYWKGELSEQEEDQLKQALLAQEPDLEGDLKDAAIWFKSAQGFKESLQLSDDFDRKVLDKINSAERRKDNWSWWKIAAAVIIISTLGFSAWFFPHQQQAQLAENTSDNPERAYEETKATLALMASLMDNGKSQLESLELFQKAQDKIKSQLETDKKKKDKNS